MWRYIAKRLLWLIVIVFCVAILIFTIMWFVPGDPAQIILSGSGTQAEIEALRHQMGLDRPYFVQLGEFLYNTFIRFDFGNSYVYKVPVVEELARRFPRTFLLGTLSILLSAVIGIPLGVSAGLHRNGFQDQGLLFFSMIFISVPQFWLALEMMILFSVQLHWLPVSGIDSWKCWIMPVVANTIGSIAMNARQARAAVLETARADFVTTARAKGLKENKVIWKHMIPNALIPVVNALGNSFSHVIAGTVVIETVFAFPGLGTYMLSAVGGRDYPVIRACVLLLAIFAAVVNLIVDLIYAWLDPRIKAQYIVYGARKKEKGGLTR